MKYVYNKSRDCHQLVKFSVVDAFDIFKLENFFETLDIPVVDQMNGGHSQQILWQEIDLLHNVGKANGYLFAQKLKRSDFICAATYIFQKRKGQTK